MLNRDQIKKMHNLMSDFSDAIKKNTNQHDFEVVMSAYVSTLGQIILDNFDKKDGIRMAMQIGSNISDSVYEAYKSFENSDDKYVSSKTIQL